MLKARLMRDIITATTPWFRQHPEGMEVYVTRGKVIATGTAAISFLYEYELNVLVLGYPGDLDGVTLPLLAWAGRHQPDLLFNPDRHRDGIAFDVDILDDDTVDVLFVIKATERVRVSNDAGQQVIEHLDEPSAAPNIVSGWHDLLAGLTEKVVADGLG
ncbi:phage tail protein [Sodalis sp.]|uniref:phage tail protein n=1 Tax=Sodalis sp. (in: enterobacteria) TaxID=1898979 RepID=UPI003872D3B2